MTSSRLDFVVYLGDPDEGAQVMPISEVLKNPEQHSEALDWPYVYGALTFHQKGKSLLSPVADPIFALVSKLVRTVPYLIDREQETVVFSESEHGVLLEPNAGEISVSVFVGDPYEPEEYLLESEMVPLADICDQILSMAGQMHELAEKLSPATLEDNPELGEFLDTGKDAFKTYKLEVERGIRVK